MKIPDVLYKIGGLITFINIFGKIINTSINLSMKQLTIIKQLFDFTEEENLKSLSCNNTFINSKSELINLNNDNNINTNKIHINQKNNYNKDDLISAYNRKLLSIHWNNNNSQRQQNKYIDKHRLKKISFKTDIVSLKKNQNKIKVMKKKKIDKIIEPEKAVNIIIKKNLIRFLICCCSKNKKRDIYDFVNEIFNEKCDILNYFNLFKDIEFIKEIFFNPNQILAMDSIKKLNINFKKELNSKIYNDNKIYKIINYFNNKYKSRTNSNIDNYIYEKLEHNIKDKIKKK